MKGRISKSYRILFKVYYPYLSCIFMPKCGANLCRILFTSLIVCHYFRHSARCHSFGFTRKIRRSDQHGNFCLKRCLLFHVKPVFPRHYNYYVYYQGVTSYF